MVSVPVSSLWVVLIFAAIGIVLSFPIIWKATTTFWKSVWYILAVHKHNGDMGKAFKMLPRLARTFYKTGRASENIYPHVHLVYHFGTDRVENRITDSLDWLDAIGNWLDGSKNGARLKFTMLDDQNDPHSISMKRTTMDLVDGVHDVLVIENFHDDGFITSNIAHAMWHLLPTVRFYSKTIDYILIVNCPESISYVSTIPSEVIEVRGIRYSVFACPEKFPHIDLEPLRT